MPESKNAIARMRMQHTGETKSAARAGIQRDGSLGLDTDLPNQRKLRALLALGLFNRWGSGKVHPPAAWGLHTLVAYDITVSPRFDQLLLITQFPHNVAPYLLPSRDGGIGLPGLRLEGIRGQHTYLARHLPTGARLVITRNRCGSWPQAAGAAPKKDFFTANQSLTLAERKSLEHVPIMSEDIERLLAALTCRLATQDTRGKWAIGNWFADPLSRPGWLNDGSAERYGKQLWGSAQRWALRWNGFPFAEDVSTSLTAPLIGLPGATSHCVGEKLQVQLGHATLDLHGLRSPVRHIEGDS